MYLVISMFPLSSLEQSIKLYTLQSCVLCCRMAIPNEMARKIETAVRVKIERALLRRQNDRSVRFTTHVFFFFPVKKRGTISRIHTDTRDKSVTAREALMNGKKKLGIAAIESHMRSTCDFLFNTYASVSTPIPIIDRTVLNCVQFPLSFRNRWNPRRHIDSTSLVHDFRERRVNINVRDSAGRSYSSYTSPLYSVILALTLLSWPCRKSICSAERKHKARMLAHRENEKINGHVYVAKICIITQTFVHNSLAQTLYDAYVAYFEGGRDLSQDRNATQRYVPVPDGKTLSIVSPASVGWGGIRPHIFVISLDIPIATFSRV